MVELLLLAAALSADNFAVSIGYGSSNTRISPGMTALLNLCCSAALVASAQFGKRFLQSAGPEWGTRVGAGCFFLMGTLKIFEELRKQLTSLSRRIDDRNISAPAPVTTDDKIARLLETAQFTRTNVERVRMELADRITTIGKETENHTEKIIAAVAHPAQPAAQRHIHVIDFNTSWALLYMAISFIVILCGGIHITKLYDRIANLRDTELKYRYVQMMGDIDEQKLRNLNALFYDSERRADRRSLRQQVERYETAVREAIENQQRSVIRKQEAEDIRQKAKQFQKELDITK